MSELNDFKAGDEVICQSSSLNLTYGYEYKILRVDGDSVWVINNSGDEDWFGFTRFKPKVQAKNLFKKGDIVICINNENIYNLSIGKEYELAEVCENGYRVQVINDSGIHMKCFSERFISHTAANKIATMFKPYI